ncbi:hypothetical protein MMC13_008337 [Lambiella insularis]|nr:hypothetical protein [Lambiella insularis]
MSFLSDSGDHSPGPYLSVSSSSTASPLRTIDALPVCNCLQQHAELLCLLKSLEQGQNAPSADAVLLGVQHSLVPWQNLIHCPICQYDDDQSVLHLSVISIRTVLHRLQRLCTDNADKAIDWGSSAPVQQTATSAKVTIGSFEVGANERKFVTDVLILQALSRVRVALLALKDKFAQPRDKSIRSHPSRVLSMGMQHVEVDHQPSSVESAAHIGRVQQLLQSLGGTMQMVQSAIRTNPTAIHGDRNSVLGVD